MPKNAYFFYQWIINKMEKNNLLFKMCQFWAHLLFFYAQFTDHFMVNMCKCLFPLATENASLILPWILNSYSNIVIQCSHSSKDCIFVFSIIDMSNFVRAILQCSSVIFALGYNNHWIIWTFLHFYVKVILKYNRAVNSFTNMITSEVSNFIDYCRLQVHRNDACHCFVQ